MSLRTLRIYQTPRKIIFTDSNNLVLHLGKDARCLVGMDDTCGTLGYLPRAQQLLHTKTPVWSKSLREQEAIPLIEHCPHIVNAYEVDLRTGEILEQSVTHHDPGLYNHHFTEGKDLIERILAKNREKGKETTTQHY